jgi:hypothetical protein
MAIKLCFFHTILKSDWIKCIPTHTSPLLIHCNKRHFQTLNTTILICWHIYNTAVPSSTLKYLTPTESNIWLQLTFLISDICILQQQTASCEWASAGSLHDFWVFQMLHPLVLAAFDLPDGHECDRWHNLEHIFNATVHITIHVLTLNCSPEPKIL